jgi:type IV pilus assembly protein PilB
VVPDSAVFYAPAGCETCHEGYNGRFVLHEYFTFTPALRAAFLRGAPAEELTKLARKEGQISSFAAGVQKAVEGLTSLDEVMHRVPHWRA